jgi:hypothetical protein
MIDMAKWKAKADAAKQREVNGVNISPSAADLYDDPTFENNNSYPSFKISEFAYRKLIFDYANSFLDAEDQQLFKAYKIVPLDGYGGYRIEFKLKSAFPLASSV